MKVKLEHEKKVWEECGRHRDSIDSYLTHTYDFGMQRMKI